MAKTFLLCLSLAIITLSLSSLSSAASHTTVYASFLNCLEANTKPADQISSLVFSRTNTSYTSVLQAYIRNARLNTSSSKPLIIITPKQISHVQAAVICTKKVGYQLKIRSGGHDYEGISYISDQPFFILDMFNLRDIQIDIKDESAWVQSGATLGELYYSIWKQSNVHGFPAGVCPTVGVGGHLGGGGYGHLIRKFGLTVDHVIDAQIVDVNGKFMDRKAMGEDLFWAIRGGGGASFGVVVAYKIKLVRVPEKVTVFRVERTIEQNATDFVYKWQSVAPKISDDLFMRLLLQPITRNNVPTVRASIVAMYTGDANSLLALLAKEFPEVNLTREGVIETSFIDSVVWWSNFANGTDPKVLLNRTISVSYGKRKSDYVQKIIPKEGLEALWKKMIELGKIGMVFNPYGGQMDLIPASATPFPHRAGNLWKIQYSVNWNEAGDAAAKKYITQARDLYSFMTPYVSSNPRSAFLNYRDLDIGVQKPGKYGYKAGSVYGYKYFNGNFDRLVKIKTAVDPQNFFRNEQSIPTHETGQPGAGENQQSGAGRPSSYGASVLKLTGVLFYVCRM